MISGKPGGIKDVCPTAGKIEPNEEAHPDDSEVRHGLSARSRSSYRKGTDATDGLRRGDRPHRQSAAGSQAKKDAQAKIEQLKPLRARVEAQLQKVKAATPQAWEDIKAGVGSAFDDLRKAFEKASAHFQ